MLITSDPAGKDLVSVDWLIRKYSVTVLPSVASLKILRGDKSTIAAVKPMIGFGDPVFDRTTRAIGRPKVAALNRSLTSFYRGVTADTKALADALPPLPETADELRAVANILGRDFHDSAYAWRLAARGGHADVACRRQPAATPRSGGCQSVVAECWPIKWPTKTSIKMKLRACGGPLWRWRCSVWRSRAQSAHSATAP